MFVARRKRDWRDTAAAAGMFLSPVGVDAVKRGASLTSCVAVGVCYYACATHTLLLLLLCRSIQRIGDSLKKDTSKGGKTGLRLGCRPLSIAISPAYTYLVLYTGSLCFKCVQLLSVSRCAKSPLVSCFRDARLDRPSAQTIVVATFCCIVAVSDTNLLLSPCHAMLRWPRFPAIDAREGRFGIGFNSVYHLTELPAFVSAGKWCSFDPQAKFLPNVNPANPGKMVDFIKYPDTVQRYPDQVWFVRCRPMLMLLMSTVRSLGGTEERRRFSVETYVQVA